VSRRIKILRACQLSLVLLVCTGVPACAKTSQPPLTQERVHQLRTGMTVEQIEAILGAGEEIQPSQVPALSSPGLARKWLRWMDGENRVYVGFNDGRVVTISSQFED
jgi:hypothetical protein